MAFSYALDFERGEMYRKESLLIINNFLMTFCHDNKLTSSQLLPTQDESVSEDTDNSISPANPKSSSDHDAINELLKIFEHCGFFDHLKDILDIKPTIIPYRCAVSALLLNMALIAPDCLRRKIHESQAWGLLISHMDGIDDISSSIVEMEEGGKAYSLLKGRQFHQIYNELGNQMEINTLHIIRLLEKDHEHTRLYLIQHTTIFQHLLQKIAYQFITLDQANGSTLASIGLCCRILSDLIWDFCQIDPAGLSKTFSVRENIVCLLECLEFLTSLTSDIELNSSGCVLLAKIASLHYGEVVNLGLDTYLIGPDQIVDGVDAGNDELGRKLVRNLVEILLNNYDSDDAMRMESVRISLQCFFGKCQFAKKEAIVGKKLYHG